MGSNTFLYIALGIGALFLLYLLVDLLIIRKWKKDKHSRLVRILLFEHVGDDKIFRGVYDGHETQDEKLGAYLMINKIKISLGLVNNSDYFPDKKFGKCLLVCKYSMDDFRVMSRIKNGEWFKKVKLAPEKYLETETVEDENGDLKTRLVTDNNGKYIHKTDKHGKKLVDYVLRPYQEPLGVTQSDREVMRFNRDFSRRMEEKRGQKNGFWDKYGPMLVSVTVVLIAFIFMAYNTNKMAEAQVKISEQFGEKADEAIKAIKAPSFAENLLNKLENKENEEKTPPS